MYCLSLAWFVWTTFCSAIRSLTRWSKQSDCGQLKEVCKFNIHILIHIVQYYFTLWCHHPLQVRQTAKPLLWGRREGGRRVKSAKRRTDRWLLTPSLNKHYNSLEPNSICCLIVIWKCSPAAGCRGTKIALMSLKQLMSTHSCVSFNLRGSI